MGGHKRETLDFLGGKPTCPAAGYFHQQLPGPAQDEEQGRTEMAANQALETQVIFGRKSDFHVYTPFGLVKVTEIALQLRQPLLVKYLGKDDLNPWT